MRFRSRRAGALALGAAAVVALYAIRFEGSDTPIDARLVAHFPEGIQWMGPPMLVQQDGSPAVIYVLPPAPPDAAGRFAAIGIDLEGGARTSTRIPLAPDSGYVAFVPAEVTGAARVDVRGLSFSRPEFHLFSFPGNGGGAGFHRVESATGVARVVRPRTSERPVVTRIVINSASLPEMLSHVTSDRTGRLVAFVSRQQDGWTVYVWDQ